MRSFWDDSRFTSIIIEVYGEHLAPTLWERICSYGLPEKFEPADDCPYVPNDKIFIIWILGEMKKLTTWSLKMEFLPRCYPLCTKGILAYCILAKEDEADGIQWVSNSCDGLLIFVLIRFKDAELSRLLSQDRAAYATARLLIHRFKILIPERSYSVSQVTTVFLLILVTSSILFSSSRKVLSVGRNLYSRRRVKA